MDVGGNGNGGLMFSRFLRLIGRGGVVVPLVKVPTVLGAVWLRRPTVGDMLANAHAEGGSLEAVRFIARHVCDRRGRPLYPTLASLDEIDAEFCQQVLGEVERLYKAAANPPKPHGP